MRKLAIITILIISIFLIGCAKTEITTMSDKEYDSRPASTEKTYTVAEEKTEQGTTYTSKEGVDEEDKDDTISVSTKDGDTVTFKKQDTYERSKEMTEECYLPYPLECADYFAKDGVIYLKIKNAGYQSKLNQVVLTLDNDECDPVETYIETGQLKEFECFSDEPDFVSGTLEMEYYKPIGKVHEIKTGQLVVMME
jgi:hypothetical protein